MSEPAVVDNPDAHRYELHVDGELAELVYERDGNRLKLVHTGVPESLNGRGLGGQLVAAALADAKRRGDIIVAECPFARSWLERHPDQTQGVTIE